MKIRILLSVVVATLLTCAISRAASQTWTAGVNSNWDTTTANWSGSTWVNGGDAFFNGTGIGTINVGTGITANSLTFNNAGYTLAGGSLTLGGATPAITANADATISSILAGTSGLIKSGGGTLTLTGTNSYSGTTTINGGVLQIGDGTPGHDGSLASTSIVNNANLIFNLSGSSACSGVISGTGTTTVKAGTLTVTGTIAIAGTLALNGGSALNFCLAGVGSSGLIQITGTCVAPSSPVTINLINVQNLLSWQYGMSGGTYSLITGAAGISASSFVLGSIPSGYSCALSAANGTLSVIVTPTTAQVGLLGAAPATSGSAFSYQVSLVSNATGYSATGLPSGLSLNSSTGLITGTVTTPGIYYATVSATNSGGVVSSPLLIAVPPATPYVESSNNPPVFLSSSGGNMTVQPVLDNTLLINPGKGWVEYFGPSVYTASLIGVGYSRFTWADVEPTEGVFNWDSVNNMVAAYAPYGLKIAFGIMNVDAIPPWVFESGTNPVTQTVYPTGAAPLTVSDPYGGSMTVPQSWEDPVYIARLQEFIAAFGAQYNGSANIAHVDILDYGMDGEENGAFVSGLSNVTPAQLQNDFFQPYLAAFPDTQLDVNTNVGGLYANVYAWAGAQGVGAMRCGICSFWSANGSENLVAYPHAPGIMEYANTWADTVASGIDPNTGMAYASPGELMMYITGGRTSYMQFHPEFYNLYPAFCQMAGNIIGYHFVIQQATIPTTVQANVQFPMSLTWLNNGVAPVYNPCHVAAAVLDANNNVVQQQWLPNSNPAGWLPGVSTTENYNVTFTSVPAGYRLAVGLFVNQTDVNPTYRLGIQGRTVNGWYILTGTVNQAAATWTNAAGGSWQTAGNWTGSSVRNGIDATADFSTLNLTGNATVTLDGNVTVGNLLFGDASPGNNWMLNAGTGGVLTLQSSPNAPAPGITVTNGTTTINTGLAGLMGQGLVKSGTGRLVLNGTNTFLGSTTVNAGVLEVTTNTSLYTAWSWGVVTINVGGTLQLDGWVGYGGESTGDINQMAIDDPASLVINGGTLAFGGTGGTSPRAFSIGDGGATLMNSSANSSLWDFSLGGNTTQDTVSDNSSLTLDGLAGTFSQIDKVITGAGSLTKNGPGTWTLTGTNTYSGATTVNAGILYVSSGQLYNSSGTGVVTVNSGATLRIDGLGTSGHVDSLGMLGSSGTCLVLNGGTLEYSGAAQSYAGRNFTVGAGGATLKASQTGGTWWLASGVDPITNNSSLTLTGTSTGDIQMPVIGSGSLFKTGNGEWDIEGTNTCTGATTVNAGTLRLGSAAATLGVNSALTLANVSGAVFSLSYWDPNAVEASGTGQNVGGHVSIGSLAGGGANGGNVELCSGVLTVGGDNTSTTYAGSILSSQIWRSNPNGIGALTKVGTGTLTLSGANSYKGATTISQGRLDVPGSLSAGSAVSVGAAGILGGTGVIGGPVTVNGTLAPGTGSIGSLAIASALTLSGTASFRISKSGSVLSNDKVTGLTGVSYGGALVVANIGADALAAGDTFTLFASGSYAGTFSSLTLPALGGNLVWNTSNLAVNGSIGVMIPTTPPAAPAGLMAVAGNAQVSLSWSVSAGATGYNVRRSTVSGSNYTVIAANTAASSYTDNAVSNWIPYYYVVSAINLKGEGLNSSQASATPQSPSISTAERAESTRLSLSGSNAAVGFTASVPGHTYQLQYVDTLTSGTWTNFGAPQAGTGTDLLFTAPYDSTVQRRFYRLQISQ